MISNRQSPLTPLAQESLETLANALPSDGELTYEQAYTTLKDREELEQPTAEDIIERHRRVGTRRYCFSNTDTFIERPHPLGAK
ncbi:hypothetical protein [Haladaptatus caseinilyticus]|uniref:hypothetical protein n=1 Tax=Haladaptatus caseinilyticus TaxID=2993314 RepID=UPI00224B1B9A|nr:hypothetical protein [Haladaptatus caseinilyticus]